MWNLTGASQLSAEGIYLVGTQAGRMPVGLKGDGDHGTPLAETHLGLFRNPCWLFVWSKVLFIAHLSANCFPSKNGHWRTGSMFVINKIPINSGLFWVPKVGFYLYCFISCYLLVCLALFALFVCTYLDDSKASYYLRFFLSFLQSLVSGVTWK